MTAGRRVWITGLVLVAVGGTATGALLYANRARAGEQATAPKPLPTVAVTRGDLVSSTQQPGQLGYSGSYQLVGHRAGTVTAAPQVGQMIDRGQPVYAVDQRPIPLLFGSIPLYRQLGVDATGEDVRQLEQNLVELGHATNLTVDTRYTAATAAAVQRWQRALGVPDTGAVDAGDAVVAPGPVRIAAGAPLVGAASGPGEVVAAATGTGHGVRVDLDRRYRSLAEVDRTVRIQLFGGRAVEGVVATVGAAAAPAEDSGAGQPGNQGSIYCSASARRDTATPPTQQQTIPVDIRITSQEAELGGVFEGPVTVIFPGETRRGVLSVPIEALTLGTGGDYAVVVVDPTGRRVVDVVPGLITSTRVEISGHGIAEGMRVEVPGL